MPQPSQATGASALAGMPGTGWVLCCTTEPCSLRARLRASSAPAGGRATQRPRLPQDPHPYQEEAVQYFFDHAAKAAEDGKPLRFHFQTAFGKSFIYGMVICKDVGPFPDGRHVIFVPDAAAAQKLAGELGAFNLPVHVVEPVQDGSLFAEDAASLEDPSVTVLVCPYVTAWRLEGRAFRIKLIDEAHVLWGAEDDESKEQTHHIRRTVTAQMTADFTTTFNDKNGDGSAMKNGSGQSGRLTWWSVFSSPYSLLWKSIIRPPRATYAAQELGLTKFLFKKNVYERKDIRLESPRGKLECSHFFMRGGSALRQLCVVYLHGNCSSRLEVFDALPVLLSRGLAVFALDLSGSGWSDGEFISLGHYEELDLKVVLEYLRGEDAHTSAIGLWGRSMGAAAAVLRAAEDHELAGCVLDSPFSDLRVVIEEYVNHRYVRLPDWMMKSGLELLRSEVQTRANFNPLELAPIRAAPRATCPALFGVAADDGFVLPHHTEEIHNAWAGARELRHFEGGHGGKRPRWFMEEGADFLLEQLSKWSNRQHHPAVTRRKAYAL